MSVINPNETAKSWKTSKREHAVQIYVSGVEGDAGALAGARVANFPLSLSIVPVTDWIDPDEISGAVAAVIQVDPDTPSSIKRFQKLAQTVSTPLIAAAYEPPLALVRSLIRSGAHDVLPLPLTLDELETSIALLGERIDAAVAAKGATQTGKLVKV